MPGEFAATIAAGRELRLLGSEFTLVRSLDPFKGKRRQAI
jgi:hypothetical protein